MAVFKSERVFWGSIDDLEPVAQDLVAHFRGKGYEAMADHGASGIWDVSIHKGGTFKAIVGLKTALKVLIVPEPDCVRVTAGIGVFGRSVAPAALGAVGIRAALMVGAGAAAATVVGLPLLVAAAWGLVRQAKLDDEAMTVIAASITRIAPEVAAALGPVKALPAARPAGDRSCDECGTPASAEARFCGECGAKLPS